MPKRKPTTSTSGSAAQRAPAIHTRAGALRPKKAAPRPAAATAWEKAEGIGREKGTAGAGISPAPAGLSLQVAQQRAELRLGGQLVHDLLETGHRRRLAGERVDT